MDPGGSDAVPVRVVTDPGSQLHPEHGSSVLHSPDLTVKISDQPWAATTGSQMCSRMLESSAVASISVATMSAPSSYAATPTARSARTTNGISEMDSRLPEELRWARSIDGVYSLFENPMVAAQYPALSERVRAATQLTEEVVRDLGPRRIALSFNGGKDCTVLAHILAAVYRRLSSHPADSSGILPMDAAYIQCPAPFSEVEDFIRISAQRYNMEVRCINGDMKTALSSYLSGQGQVFVPCPAVASTAIESSVACRSKPAVQSPNGPLIPGQRVTAMFIGTRSTDPNGGGLPPRAWTDPGWPQVERIQPVLDWDYKDIWDFLRCPHLSADSSQDPPGVPYCSLYDEGYTSLGSTYNTFPNPELKLPQTIDGIAAYRPAYQLASAALERCGRGKEVKQ